MRKLFKRQNKYLICKQTRIWKAGDHKRSDPSILRDETGATAIEFAILGIPFLALLFGILELAMIFFISSTTQHALETVARQIRTGEFQNAGDNWSTFKDQVCTGMAGVGDCDNLRIDVVSSGTSRFSDLVLPISPTPTVCTGTTQEIEDCEEAAAAAPPVMPTSTYTSTSGQDIVIVRVQYLHTLAVPSTLTRLSNAPGNTRIITHTTVFKNEPF